MKKVNNKKEREGKSRQKNSYALRTSNVYVLNPSTKLEYEQKNVVKCPPLPRKSMSSVFGERDTAGAIPIGNKGHLSALYNKSLKVTYIGQLFQEIDKIGEGSFGSVHKYRSLEDGHCYAIKTIKRMSTTNKYGEVHCLDKVTDNPYCIQYVNAWEEAGVIYIQFELAVMSLADYAKKNHNICEEECWNILYDVLKALVPLHESGLCHNDIKPDNIMISYDGKYKLCDFGLLTDVGTKSGKSQLLISEGDAKYIADEVLQGEASTAGDIFALGISLMELSMDLLLPGYGPCWHHLRQCSWRLLPDNAKGRISFDLETIINWMMQLDPSNRPTAEQLMRTPKMLDRRRAKKPRFDYFTAWRNENEDSTVDVPTVLLMSPSNTSSDTPRTPSSERSLSPVTTPTRRVSSIIVRQSILMYVQGESPSIK